QSALMNQFLLGAVLMLAAAQHQQTPGINFFSPQQDIEIGSESAREAEKSMPVLRDGSITAYVRGLGIKLIRHNPARGLQFRFRVVNSKEIDSFAFPGGAIFVNRGLIELAANEDELAAILAHEIAHTTARHGTSQLSKQLLVQSPVSVASGLAVT